MANYGGIFLQITFCFSNVGNSGSFLEVVCRFPINVDPAPDLQKALAALYKHAGTDEIYVECQPTFNFILQHSDEIEPAKKTYSIFFGQSFSEHPAQVL